MTRALPAVSDGTYCNAEDARIILRLPSLKALYGRVARRQVKCFHFGRSLMFKRSDLQEAVEGHGSSVRSTAA